MITGNFILSLAYTGPYQLIQQVPGTVKLLNLSANPSNEELNIPYFGIYGTREEVLIELNKRVNVFFDALEKENAT